MQYKNGLSYQIQQLFNRYPNLKIEQEDEHNIEIVGKILVSGKIEFYIVYEEYQVKILVSKELNHLPQIYEIGGTVEKSYAHKAGNNSLCLETDTAIKLHFLDGFDLVEWMEKYVETYFISYEFFKRYGKYPFGERPHGVMGVIDTYQQLFKENSFKNTFKIMLYIAKKAYRGHNDCPCGSGLKIRNCHGKVMKPFYEDKKALEIIKKDIEYIKKEVKDYGNNINKR